MKSLNEHGSKCLNRRGELFRNCVHRYKHLLGSINTKKKDEDNIYYEVPEYSQISQQNNIDRGAGKTRSGKQWRK